MNPIPVVFKNTYGDIKHGKIVAFVVIGDEPVAIVCSGQKISYEHLSELTIPEPRIGGELVAPPAIGALTLCFTDEDRFSLAPPKYPDLG